MTKKEFILGSAIIFWFVLSLANLMREFISSWIPLRLLPRPLLSGTNLSNAFALVLILMSVISFVHGVLAAAGIVKGASRLTFRASIPVYLLFPLVPMSSGFILLFLTGEVALSVGLAVGGILASVIFALLGIRSAKQNDS